MINHCNDRRSQYPWINPNKFCNVCIFTRTWEIDRFSVPARRHNRSVQPQRFIRPRKCVKYFQFTFKSWAFWSQSVWRLQWLGKTSKKYRNNKKDLRKVVLHKVWIHKVWAMTNGGYKHNLWGTKSLEIHRERDRNFLVTESMTNKTRERRGLEEMVGAGFMQISV